MHVRGSSNAVPIQFMEGDTLMTKPVEVATLYNDYCVNITRCIGQPTADTSHMYDAEFVVYSVVKYLDHSSVKCISDRMGKSVPITFNFIEVSIYGVNKILNILNPKKATGYHQIPPHCLRDGTEHLAGPMAYLFNEAIHQSCFPTAHKAAEVGPQHKKADVLRKENYRPVSILISTSNVYEKIMNNQMSTLQKHVFSDELSATREGYSTQYVLVNLVEKLKSTLDRSKCGGSLLTVTSEISFNTPQQSS